MGKWIAIIVIILAGVFVSLPYLAGIPPFKQFTLRLIKKRIDADIQIERLRLSWFGPQKLIGVQFQTAEFSGAFEEIDANSPLWAMTRNFTLSGGSIHASQTSSSIEDVQAKIIDSAINVTGRTLAESKSGQFSIRGTMINPKLFDLLIDIEKMPTAIVDWFLKTEEKKLQSILGPNFDLKGTVAMKERVGIFDLVLTSPTANTAATGSMMDGVIRLERDFICTLSLTPAMSLALFNNTVAVTGQDPIILKVIADGFEFSRPFSLQTLKIHKASLNLGRIRLQNADYLSGLSIFLKTGKINTKQVDAWFNRADFSLENGFLDLKRMDALLAHSIHLCTWGKANLIQQTLDMILGIPEEVLRQTFGIKTLSSKYVLQIPLKGTFDNPQLDTGAASRKIAAIVAAGKLQGKGGILGEALGVFNEAALERSPPPNAPFPWGK
jgi:hypothetical protein